MTQWRHIAFIFLMAAVIWPLSGAVALAQSEGGACASPYNTLGASVITNSGNVYTRWQCDNGTTYRGRQSWDISTARTVINWAEDGTCNGNALGQMAYDTGTAAFKYCNGTSWMDF